MFAAATLFPRSNELTTTGARRSSQSSRKSSVAGVVTSADPAEAPETPTPPEMPQLAGVAVGTAAEPPLATDMPETPTALAMPLLAAHDNKAEHSKPMHTSRLSRDGLLFFINSYIVTRTMATKKAGGSTKNGRDSGPQYLGIMQRSPICV